jgi:hypothetical protein
MRAFPMTLAALLLAATSLTALPAQATPPTPHEVKPTPETPAPAAGAPSAAPALPPVSPEAHQEAAALTDLIGVSRQSQQLIDLMRSQMIQLVIRAGNKTQDEATKIVDEVLMPDFVARQSELTNNLIDVWARAFSVDDLKALEVFYKTPLGQKLIQTLPAVTQQGMQAGQAWGQSVYQEAITKHKDELILRGLKF